MRVVPSQCAAFGSHVAVETAAAAATRAPLRKQRRRAGGRHLCCGRRRARNTASFARPLGRPAPVRVGPQPSQPHGPLPASAISLPWPVVDAPAAPVLTPSLAAAGPGAARPAHPPSAVASFPHTFFSQSHFFPCAPYPLAPVR